MSDEDLKLLQAVREWRPPATLHPIAMHAFHLYEANSNQLSEKEIDQLRAVLDGYGDDLKGLAEAIEGLVRFLVLLTDREHDQVGGTKIAELLRSYTPRFEPFWQRVGEAISNVGAVARGSFLAFADRKGTDDKVAPLEGQGAPEGSVPLRSLAPPPRPPRWMKKATAGRT